MVSKQPLKFELDPLASVKLEQLTQVIYSNQTQH